MPRILTPADVAGFRERLCEVAARLYAELGPAGFNMRELARRVGVSAMTPYRYFRDKEEILSLLRLRAFARLADQLEAAQASVNSAAERHLAAGRAYLGFAMEDPTYYRLMFDLSQPDAGGLVAREERRAIAALQPKGGARDRDDDLSGPMLWAALHGVVALHLAGRFDAAQLARLVPAMLHSFAGTQEDFAPRPVPAMAGEWRSVA